MIKTVFFDFGNVLVTYNNVFNKVCHDFQIDFNEFKKHYLPFEDSLTIGKISTDIFWKKCFETFNLDLQKALQYDFKGSWVSDYEIIQPINKLINELDGKMNIGIISNINSGIWEAALRDSWVPSVNYKSVILSCDVGMAKPNRGIYEIAQNESGVDPNEILFIDDKEMNLREPLNMGWSTVLFDPNNAKDGIKKIRRIIGN